jgi:hypothetical protein
MVQDGKVTLTGMVDNWAEKRFAERLTRSVKGVRDVENNLKVRPPTSLSDSEIEDRIEAALIRDAVLERYDIDITVRNRKAYLYGMVDSYYERDRAGDVASAVQGVVDVENNLGVDYTWVWKDDVETWSRVRQHWTRKGTSVVHRGHLATHYDSLPREWQRYADVEC